jgi:hypothetical protein
MNTGDHLLVRRLAVQKGMMSVLYTQHCFHNKVTRWQLAED